MGDGKRRLPLVKEPEAAREEDVARPAWHWTIIGAFATWLAWLLLEMVAVPLLGAVDRSAAAGTTTQPLLVAVHFSALALAAFAGGLFVGRFGVQAGRLHAAIAGAIVVVPPWLVVATRVSGAGDVPFLAVLLALLAGWSTGAAYLGGRLGFRLR